MTQSTSDRLDEARRLEHTLDSAVALEEYASLRTAPDRVDRCRALIGFARCLLQTRNRGETDRAEEALEEARTLIAEIGDPYLEGELLLQWGHIQEHQGFLQRALERYTRALELLPDQDSDQFVETSLELASAERRRGELELAYGRLRQIGSPALTSRMRIRYQSELGAVLIARGEYDQAITALRVGLDADDPTRSDGDARSRLLLAEALRHTGALEEARAQIEQAIDTFRAQSAISGLSEAYAQLGLWHEDSESYVSAHHAFQVSLKQDELSDDRVGQARAKRHMARVFRKSGDSTRAQELLDDAHEVLSREDHVEMAMLWREEAELALTGSAPNYKRAIERFERACQVAVEDGDARAIAVAQRHLARAYREDDDLQTAEDLLREALPELKKRGDLRELDELLDDLGEVLLEQDRYAEARVVLEQSLALDEQLGRVSSKARSLLLLGQVEHESGDQESAQRHLELAMEVYSDVKQNVGLSNVLQHMAAWHLDRGQTKRAIVLLRKGLEIDSRMDDPLGRARARRLLAAAHRQRGNLERAEEYLEEARQDLGQIDDPVEDALIDCELGRIALSRGFASVAATHLRGAQAVFEAAGHRPVDVATCERLRAMAEAHQGSYTEALALLDHARHVFEERGDIPELDELHDDLAEVWLLQGRLDLARESANNSLAVGGPADNWSFGRGRSLLLLAQIGMQEGGESRSSSRTCIEDALELYKEQSNEAGRCRALLALGDWHMAEDDVNKAMIEYKSARSRAHHLRDLHMIATCNRKLATIYLARHEIQRAEDALKDATENLDQVSDPRARAPLDLEWGRLEMAKGQHAKAIDRLRDAGDGFERLRQEDARLSTLQLLSTCLQATGQTSAALECIRKMGRENIVMYSVLLSDLHPRIASTSRPDFESGNLKQAVHNAFGELEKIIKETTTALNPGLSWKAHLSEHIKVLASPDSSWGEGIAGKTTGLGVFREYITGSKEFFLNPAKHEDVTFSPASAFVAIATAHVIAETIRLRELPWMSHLTGS